MEKKTISITLTSAIYSKMLLFSPQRQQGDEFSKINKHTLLPRSLHPPPPPSNSNGRIVRSPDRIIETKGWRCGEASGQRGIAGTPCQMKLHSTCIGITEAWVAVSMEMCWDDSLGLCL